MNEPSNSVFLVLAIKMWVIRPGSADMQNTHWALYSNNSLWGSIWVNKDLPTERTHSLLNTTLQNIQLCFTAVKFCVYLFAMLGIEMQLKIYCILDNILPPNIEILEIKNKRKALFEISGKCMLAEWGFTYFLHGRHSLSDSLIPKLVPTFTLTSLWILDRIWTSSCPLISQPCSAYMGK